MLEEDFPNQLVIRGQKDSTVTGNFEITCNGELLHSKKQGGKYCLEANEYLPLVEKIKILLGQ